MMKPSAPQLSAFLWAGLGALLGGLAVTLLSPAPDAPATRIAGSAAPQSTASDPQLLELLRKLDRSLESLEVAIADIDRAPAPLRVPVDATASGRERREERPPALDDRELADALWALTQRMERLPQGGAGSSIPARDVVPVADKPAALGSGQWSARLRNGEEAWHETNQSHRNQHYGWSSDDLGQSYGHPDELWFEEGDVAVWLYEYEVEPGVYEAQSFFLKDGTVFNSEIDWWSDEEEEWEDLEFGEEPDED
ncbi:MAG: hypothetical protein ACYS26_19635 [Planctomycetota bacterium]|jgi:hypothetical protein